MGDELKMLLADHGSPEALANCIAGNFKDMCVPVPIEEIAAAVGIAEVSGVKSANFEGVLVTDAAKSKGSIAYNISSSPERRRFTIAHEIGHFLIPTHGTNAQCAKSDMSVLMSADARASKEAEANRFAANLLMPRASYLTDIRRLGPPELAHILKLASQYEVSRDAAARRYVELSEHACAVVFSHDGIIRSYSKSHGFPFLTVKPKEALPSGSLSKRVTIEPGAISEWADATMDVWLAKPCRGKTLYERVLQRANGYRLTMLTLDDSERPVDDEADEDGEDTIERSWTPPRFRR